MIAFLPAADSFRFGLGAASGAATTAPLLDAAHLLRCASAMALLPAALIFRRFFFGSSGAAAGSMGPPVSPALSSAIWASMCRFCSSNQRMAAVMISLVSFGVGISAFQGIALSSVCVSVFGSRITNKTQCDLYLPTSVLTHGPSRSPCLGGPCWLEQGGRPIRGLSPAVARG